MAPGPDRRYSGGRMRRPAPVICALALVGAAAPSAAAAPPQPALPAPAAGTMSIALQGGVPTRHARFYYRGQHVVVVGAVRPFVPGQLATLLVVRHGRVAARYRVPIEPGRTAGRFVVGFTPRGSGRFRLVALHEATPQQAAFRARSRTLEVVHWQAGAGAHGVRVLLLQRALRSLAYATPVSGAYDGGTGRAVLAFRKVNGMARNGYASTAVYARLFAHQGGFRLRFPRAGTHAEFDWSRQVLVLAARGRPWRIYHASSGKPSTPTVFGRFRFYRKTLGTNSHGMVDSSYFFRGYAVHGYAEVPPYAASHGCIRVPIPNALGIYRAIRIGELIFVYR
jgi:L,D-transpeptidase catalytic domain/Putative peptidoglycan binding domain